MAIRAAQKATPSIPIVGVADDMLGSGFITSFSRPTGNTTGVSILSPELDGKRQDILIEALPGLNHLALLADSNASKQAHLDVLREAARARNIEASIHSIRETRGNRAGHRCGEGRRRRCVECFGVADAQ